MDFPHPSFQSKENLIHTFHKFVALPSFIDKFERFSFVRETVQNATETAKSEHTQNISKYIQRETNK